MHSKIYQISDKPVAKDARLTEDDLDYEFVKSCIRWLDYYGEQTDRSAALGWLNSEAEKCGFKAHRGCIEWLGDTSFVEKWTQAIIDAAHQRAMWRCECLAHGDFICPLHVLLTDDEGNVDSIEPLWTWVQGNCSAWKAGKKFYIGGIFDYHY